MLRGFILAFIFVLIIIGFVIVFDICVDAFSYTVDMIDAVSRSMTNRSAADLRYADFASKVFENFVVFAPIAFLSILFIFAIHTRRR